MENDLKQYLDDMKRELREHTESVKRELLEHTGTAKHELREHTETVETRLLTEFWTWARTADARYRQHHSAVNGLDERVQLVEDRIAELERRKQS